MYETATEVEDDEILVYDWSNATVARPVGTEKLGQRPLSSFQQTPNANNFGGGYSCAESSQYRPYPNGNGLPSYSYQYNNSYNFGPQGSYQNFQTSSGYWGYSYNLNPPTNFNGTVPANFGHFNTEKPGSTKISNDNEEDAWLDTVEEIDYSKSSQQWLQNGNTFNSTGNGVESESRSHNDPNFSPLLDDEFEEIDYSTYNLQPALNKKSNNKGPDKRVGLEKSVRSKKRVSFEESVGPKKRVSFEEHVGSKKRASFEKSVEPEKRVEPEPPISPILSVPKSSLSLDELLPEISTKARRDPHFGTRNSRKRPRNDMEQSEDIDLEDLLSKTKHRVSARSYAKPTRKAEYTVSTSQANVNAPVNHKHSRVSPPSSSNENSRESQPLESSTNGYQQSTSLPTSPVNDSTELQLLRESPNGQSKQFQRLSTSPPSLLHKSKKSPLAPPPPPTLSNTQITYVGSPTDDSDSDEHPSDSSLRPPSYFVGRNTDKQTRLVGSTHNDHDNPQFNPVSPLILTETDTILSKSTVNESKNLSIINPGSLEDSVDITETLDSVCFEKSIQEADSIQDMEEDKEDVDIPLKIRTDIFEAEEEDDED